MLGRKYYADFPQIAADEPLTVADETPADRLSCLKSAKKLCACMPSVNVDIRILGGHYFEVLWVLLRFFCRNRGIKRKAPELA